jgi:integrase
VPRKPKKRAHGQGNVYQRGGGGWRIRWREGGRRRYASGFTSRELAQDVLVKILSDVAAGRAGLPPDPKSIPTLKELAEDWLDRRVLTNRSHRDDRSRWDNHLVKFFGHHRPADVTPAEIRRFAELKLTKGLSSTTVGHIVRLLSVFFSDLVERGIAQVNPVRALPRTTRRLLRNAHDPRTTPFLEKLDDVRRVFLALSDRYGVMFAIGALGGLRPGEVLGLHWADVDLDANRIMVHQQVHRGELGPVKDDESRVVPILAPLAPVLAAWKLATGGKGLLFPPLAAKRGGRPGSPPRFVREHTLGTRLRAVLDKLELNRPGLNWYRCTRHTFASQWVIGGGSVEKLAKILGHASITTTERYAHLRVDLFRESDLRAVAVDLSRPSGEVVELLPRSGEGTAGCGSGAEAELEDQHLSVTAEK